MITVRDRIAKVNAVYFNSLDAEELKKAEKDIIDISENTAYIDDDNKQNCEALFLKISCKRAAIAYFLEGYCSEDCDKLKQYAEYVAKEAAEKGYGRTAEIARRLILAATCVNEIMFDAACQRDTIRNGAGECIAVAVEECEKVAEIFSEKVKKAQELDVDPIFEDGVEFPFVKEIVLNDLNDELSFAQRNAERMKNADIERLYKDIVSKPDGILSTYNYHPACGIEATKANALVICTPITAEGEFFAIANCRLRDRELTVINAASLSQCSAKNTEKLFTLIASKGKDLLIKGLSKYAKDNKKEIIKQCVLLGKKGIKVFIIDTDPKKSLYVQATELAGGEGGFTVLDVSFIYLAMPNYETLKKELFDRGMLGEDYALMETLKPSILFAGYIGVNKAFNAYAADRDWKAVFINESDANKNESVAYLRSLPSQLPLLDAGWGDFAELIDKNVSAVKKEFNYDELRDIDIRNVRSIIEGDFTLYAKCGLAAKYAVLHGQDKSLWENLSKEEKEKRLDDAVKLVYFLLDLPLTPVVTIEKLDEGVGGLCCDGGKEIKFSIKSCNNAGFVIDTVCHECHHALQHEAVDGQWKDWYWTELGITPGRIAGWKENFDPKYHLGVNGLQNNFNAYYVQSIEVEARAFGLDCVRQADAVWSKAVLY